MGKQFRFYLCDEDLTDLFNKSLSGVSIALLKNKIEDNESGEIESLLGFLGGIYGIQIYMTSEGLLSDVSYKQIKNTNISYINVANENVVELIRCFYDEKVFRSGRMYYVDNYLSDGIKIKKPENFINWVKDIFKRVKKSLIFEKSIDAYFGEKAYKIYLSKEREFIY
jgi:hypothetical protein